MARACSTSRRRGGAQVLQVPGRGGRVGRQLRSLQGNHIVAPPSVATSVLHCLMTTTSPSLRRSHLPCRQDANPCRHRSRRGRCRHCPCPTVPSRPRLRPGGARQQGVHTAAQHRRVQCISVPRPISGIPWWLWSFDLRRCSSCV
jgi:hypothetical protein